MTSGGRTGGIDLHRIASLLSAATGIGYVWLIEQQGARPVAWFLSGLVMSAVPNAASKQAARQVWGDEVGVSWMVNISQPQT